MLRTIMPALVLALIWTMAGCSTVGSDKPVGDKPVVLNPGEWEGKWLCDGEWLTIHVLDSKQGLIEFSNPFEEERIRVSIRQSGNWHFANIDAEELGDKEEPQETDKTEDAEESPDAYLWGRIVKERNTILFWMPDGEKFVSLVKAGKFPGEVEAGEYTEDVLLKGLNQEHLKLIMSEDEGVLFEWERPLALVREKPVKDAKNKTDPAQLETTGITAESGTENEAERLFKTALLRLTLRTLEPDLEKSLLKPLDEEMDEATLRSIETWLHKHSEEARQKKNPEAQLHAEFMSEMLRALEKEKAEPEKPSRVEDDAKQD